MGCQRAHTRATNEPAPQVALANGLLLLPHEQVTGKVLLIEGGRIAAIVPANSLGSGIGVVDVQGRFIAPGLVDIHTHGARGHTFNEPTSQAYASITHENASHGVTSLVATLATAPISDLEACLDFCRTWMRHESRGSQILGVHLEGPYLSAEQAGAQDPANLRNPNDGTLDVLLQYADVLRIVTYAPELPGADELTRRLTTLGIVPAAGHSSAHDDDVARAMKLGLRHTIHIWSGQSSVIREGPWRRPGLLEAALTFDSLTAEMIADDRHLPATLMKLAYKCLGADRLCVVSDATSGAGLPEGTSFHLAAVECEVRNGVGMLRDHTAFAGSTTLLGDMIKVLTAVAGIPLVEAIRMATLTPSRVVGCDRWKGSLAPGKDADITVLEPDLSVWRTMIGGRWATDLD